MNRTKLRQLVPHYVAVMVLVLVVVIGLDGLVGLPFWIGLVLALAIGAIYRPLVTALGIAPAAWDD